MLLNPADNVPDEVVEEEENYFRRIVAAYRRYKQHALFLLQRKQRQFSRLPESHKKLLKKHGRKLDFIASTCIEQNATLIRAIVPENDDDPDAEVSSKVVTVTDVEMGKVRSMFRHFVRDWSLVGKEERRSSYSHIVHALETYYHRMRFADRYHLYI
jgi:hypothetical protein